jgi:hypothetical protein
LGSGGGNRQTAADGSDTEPSHNNFLNKFTLAELLESHFTKVSEIQHKPWSPAGLGAVAA